MPLVKACLLSTTATCCTILTQGVICDDLSSTDRQTDRQTEESPDLRQLRLRPHQSCLMIQLPLRSPRQYSAELTSCQMSPLVSWMHRLRGWRMRCLLMSHWMSHLMMRRRRRRQRQSLSQTSLCWRLHQSWGARQKRTGPLLASCLSAHSCLSLPKQSTAA